MEKSRAQFASWEEASNAGNLALKQFLANNSASVGWRGASRASAILRGGRWKRRPKFVGDYRKPAGSGRWRAAIVRPHSVPSNGDGMGATCVQEELRSPVGEQIDPPTSENSEATPVEILASSLLTPSRKIHSRRSSATGRDHTRDCPCREASLQSCGASRLHASALTVADEKPQPPRRARLHRACLVCGGWRP